MCCMIEQELGAWASSLAALVSSRLHFRAGITEITLGTSAPHLIMLGLQVLQCCHRRRWQPMKAKLHRHAGL